MNYLEHNQSAEGRNGPDSRWTKHEHHIQERVYSVISEPPTVPKTWHKWRKLNSHKWF